MRRSWMTTIATIAAAVSFGSSAAAANPNPNIVYIISDDQGWKDVGYRASDIKTTNIDTLAQGGARLEQFYAQPMCTLTLAAVMRGRYPFRYGLQIAIPTAHPYRLPTDEWLLAPGAEGGQLRDCPDRRVAHGSHRPRRASARRPRSPAVGASAERARARQQISEPSWPISSARSAPGTARDGKGASDAVVARLE